MRYFPVFLDLRGQPVLLVGAGTVAQRKLGMLRRAGARVRVVAPLISFGIAELASHSDDGIEIHARPFECGDIEGMRFVIAATSDPAVNARVAEAATARGIPVNVVDAPALCTAILPAIVDRDPVLVAIGTEGTAPVLARRLRERIETLLDPSLGALARLCERWRGRIRRQVSDTTTRRKLWESIVDGEPAAAIRAGRNEQADAAIARLLTRTSHAAVGSVALVGAGPGDPGLLTLNALRAIQDADIVFHDALVSDAVLELVRRDAERISVGKRGGTTSVAQSDIHRRLLEAARRGLRVVRLKGGDPLTFARGGEELQFLHRHGIAFSIVPGITAATACAAYAGIPLTHRDHAQALQLVTAHSAGSLDRLDWRALAGPNQTLAVYMGISAASELVARLLGAGADPQTPVAVVENGSRPTQRVVLAQLDGLVQALAEAQVAAPALLLIGEVAAFAESLAWFGAPPIDLRPRASLARAA